MQPRGKETVSVLTHKTFSIHATCQAKSSLRLISSHILERCGGGGGGRNKLSAVSSLLDLLIVTSHHHIAQHRQQFKKLDKDLTGLSLLILAVLVGDRPLLLLLLLLQYWHCVPFQSPPLQPRFPLLLALRQSVGFSRSRRRGFLHLKVSHVAQRHPNCGTYSCCRLSVLSRKKPNNWCLQKCCCLLRKHTDPEQHLAGWNLLVSTTPNPKPNSSFHVGWTTFGFDMSEMTNIWASLQLKNDRVLWAYVIIWRDETKNQRLLLNLLKSVSRFKQFLHLRLNAFR